MEDSFSRDLGGGDGSGGDASDGGVGWGTADEALLAGPPAAHLLPCGLVPSRPRTETGPWPESWGPLLY